MKVILINAKDGGKFWSEIMKIAFGYNKDAKFFKFRIFGNKNYVETRQQLLRLIQGVNEQH